MLPKVIKEGKIDLDGITLEVYVLDNGQRVISEESMKNFTTRLEEGKLTEDHAKKIGDFIYKGLI